jgi:hypothetical protein
MARDLVRRNVDVILASGVPSVVAAQTASNTTPVVFVAAVDPKEAHLVTSLARPGGNVTGISSVFGDLTGKRLELLKEIVPSLSRVVFLSRAANPGHAAYALIIETFEPGQRPRHRPSAPVIVIGMNNHDARYPRHHCPLSRRLLPATMAHGRCAVSACNLVCNQPTIR